MSNGVKFLLDNYVTTEILANSFVSSEQTQFPVDNAYNLNRRSKVWRSNGYFNITSSNNVLIFREQAGVDLTATVSIAEYNSTSDFLSALKNALDSAGVATYTVTQTTDKKINISSNLGGGATVFQIRGADVLSTIVSTIGFSPSNGYTGQSNYTADLIRINTSEWITWDSGIASRPNAFAMTGSKLTGLKLSPSSQVVLKGNPTNPLDWSNPEVEIDIEFDDEMMAYISEEDFTTTGLRYWRLEILDVDNAYGFIEVGAFFLGKWWAPANSCAQFPFDIQFNDRTETLTSEGGQTFSDIKPITQTFQLVYSFLDKTDKEDLEFWFFKYGTGRPFFISFDTDSIFTTVFNKSMKFVKFSQNPSIQLYKPNKFSTSIGVKEEL